MFVTRRKHYSIFQGRSTEPKRYRYSHLQNPPLDPSPAAESRNSSDSDDFSPASSSATLTVINHQYPQPQYSPKYRRIFGIWTIRTPNSSRFANHFHSRILVKFPFLIEMFYWAISFFFYRLTGIMAQIQYGGAKSLWDIAQGHGIAILELESWLLGMSTIPGKERWVEYLIQQWYLTGADGGDARGIWLTILDRGYSLIHIPGTVGYVLFCFLVPLLYSPPLLLT